MMKEAQLSLIWADLA